MSHIIQSLIKLNIYRPFLSLFLTKVILAAMKTRSQVQTMEEKRAVMVRKQKVIYLKDRIAKGRMQQIKRDERMRRLSKVMIAFDVSKAVMELRGEKQLF